MEIHNPQCTINAEQGTEANSLLDYSSELLPTGTCPTCNDDVYGTKYCSVVCSAIGRRKVERPNKNQLLKLLETKSYCEVGRMFNVSDNAIRKWLK